MIDIGGRRLRIVCEGPQASAQPLVMFESGAFGFSADWQVVQDRLAAEGVRSCAYDRAGLGLSDPGPQPRDGLNIVKDFEALLAAASLPGPYVLVGHSMAGLRLRMFAARNPDQVAGLVLVDATTPEAMDEPNTGKFVRTFTAASNAVAVGASLGLFKPLMNTGLGDKIGLTGAAKAEKRRIFADGRHNRVAAQEVALWARAAQQARDAGPLKPQWPVAVITAGAVHAAYGASWKEVQSAPARASLHGYVEAVPGASHASLLGVGFADSIVKGIDFVMDAAAKG
jgi:pimeloyl-ACP methyl ester carboxylesterase